MPGASIERTPGSQIPEWFDNWQDHCSYFYFFHFCILLPARAPSKECLGEISAPGAAGGFLYSRAGRARTLSHGAEPRLAKSPARAVPASELQTGKNPPLAEPAPLPEQHPKGKSRAMGDIWMLSLTGDPQSTHMGASDPHSKLLTPLQRCLKTPTLCSERGEPGTAAQHGAAARPAAALLSKREGWGSPFPTQANLLVQAP